MYNIQKIKDEIQYLKENYKCESDQISLQNADGNIDFECGLGGIEDHNGYLDKDFKNLNIPEDWEMSKFIMNEMLTRTRIMILKPKRCYSWHKDWTPRVHLAIETTPKCFMVVGTELIHIPADGKPYYTDTTQFHTAFNGSKNPEIDRIHLVGCAVE